MALEQGWFKRETAVAVLPAGTILGGRWTQIDADWCSLNQMDEDGGRWIQINADECKWMHMNADGCRWMKIDTNGLRRI